MKNLLKNLLLLTSVFALTFLLSCSDDEEDVNLSNPPSVTVTAITGSGALANGGEVIAGDSIEFTIDITAAGGFNTLFFSGSLTQDPINRNDLNLDAGTTVANDIKIGWIQTTTAQVGATASIKFVASDDAGQTDTVDFAFSIVSPGIVSHTSKMLFGQSNANGGSFYDAVDDAVYGVNAAFQEENQIKLDFVFWYGNTSQYAIGAVGDANAIIAFNNATTPVNLENLVTKNETKFKVLTTTVAEFDAINNETALMNEYGEVAASDTRVSGLSAGNVFGFVLDTDRESKVGLAKVVETAGIGPTDRTITIEVKIQE
ncbi:MAG: hypothetical protein RH948_19095 [Cyclobacteriaceae bacterium]